ncbi:MAG: hypothetical protein GYA56_11150 [Geobacteraceae bacterium]|nr:hypothetical protein [Geobacteraceae bacterium]
MSDSLYDGMPPGFTQMHAWLQRGVSALEVADLDGDGSDEVAYTLSGHWNELRVYEGSGAARWVRAFGPDRAGGSFMTALEVADLDGDGRNEVLTGTKMGWLHAFDRRGNLLWQRRFHSGISALAARGNTGRVAVGCEDGALLLLDGAGNILASANLGRAVTKVLNTPRGIVAGSAAGLVRFYPHLR